MPDSRVTKKAKDISYNIQESKDLTKEKFRTGGTTQDVVKSEAPSQSHEPDQAMCSNYAYKILQS